MALVDDFHGSQKLSRLLSKWLQLVLIDELEAVLVELGPFSQNLSLTFAVGVVLVLVRLT